MVHYTNFVLNVSRQQLVKNIHIVNHETLSHGRHHSLGTEFLQIVVFCSTDCNWSAGQLCRVYSWRDSVLLRDRDRDRDLGSSQNSPATWGLYWMVPSGVYSWTLILITTEHPGFEPGRMELYIRWCLWSFKKSYDRYFTRVKDDAQKYYSKIIYSNQIKLCSPSVWYCFAVNVKSPKS